MVLTQVAMGDGMANPCVLPSKLFYPIEGAQPELSTLWVQSIHLSCRLGFGQHGLSVLLTIGCSLIVLAYIYIYIHIIHTYDRIILYDIILYHIIIHHIILYFVISYLLLPRHL